MDNKVEIKEERVPVGIISMLLAGYVSTSERTPASIGGGTFTIWVAQHKE